MKRIKLRANTERVLQAIASEAPHAIRIDEPHSGIFSKVTDSKEQVDLALFELGAFGYVVANEKYASLTRLSLELLGLELDSSLRSEKSMYETGEVGC